VDATFTPIGTVRTPYTAAEDTPIQAALNPEQEAVVELDPAYADALDGLDGFSHVWLVTWLDRPHDGRTPATGPAPHRVVPFLLRGTGRELGVLATRAPRRPNPIGLSLVRLLAVDGAHVRIRGVDLLDGTPVLDLKPWFPDADTPDEPVSGGWFDDVQLRDGLRPSDLGPPPA
jgi:tRNA (adenine37-N6)-methyltransferase